MRQLKANKFIHIVFVLIIFLLPEKSLLDINYVFIGRENTNNNKILGIFKTSVLFSRRNHSNLFQQQLKSSQFIDIIYCSLKKKLAWLKLCVYRWLCVLWPFYFNCFLKNNIHNVNFPKKSMKEREFSSNKIWWVSLKIFK